MKKPRWIVLSPDGLPINRKPFATLEKAERARSDFQNRYRQQGYYKTGRCVFIPWQEVARHCRVEVAK